MAATQLQKRFSVSNQDDKFFFCHYANMARHNAYMIIKDVTQKVFGREKEEVVNEDKLQEAYMLQIISKEKPDIFAHLVALLQDRLPSVTFLVEQNAPENTLRNLKLLLLDLQAHRNYFSHYYYDKPLPMFENFGIEKSTVCLMLLLRQAVKKARGRFKKGVSEAEKIGIEKNFNELYSAIHSHDETQRKFYDFAKPENADKRVAFFLSMFLEKRHANELISKIFGLKGTETKQKQATRESFLELCCSLPYPRLESSDFFLEVLNELNRVPAPLYHILQDSEKKKFWYDEPKETPQHEENIVSILRRHEDRFPYFSLRFFDLNNYIPGMSFQIYLGQLCIKEYKKKINKVQRDRRIVKDLSTFGRLSDYEEKINIPSCWLKENKPTVTISTLDAANDSDNEGLTINVNREIIEEVLFTPQYQITNGNIGFILDGRRDWPKWNEDVENQKLRLFSSTSKSYAVLSVHELQNLFLYAYLYKNGLITVEPKEYILQYVGNINRCINEAKSGKLSPINTMTGKIDDRNAQTNSEQNESKIDRINYSLTSLPHIKLNLLIFQTVSENIYLDLRGKLFLSSSLTR